MKPWHQFKVDHPDGYYEKEYRGYNYIVFQHPAFGHLNGYIELKEDDYNIDVENIEVHGGITYKGSLFGDKKKSYVGFDCAHLGDLCPFTEEKMRLVNPYYISFSSEGEVWRSPEFVEENCKDYIDGLIELKEVNKE